jgi:hypothetical protein
MHVPRAVWAVGYYACTAAALAAMGAVSAQIVVENLDTLDRSDAYAWLGAAAGALLGLWLARWKRRSPTTHRVLRIVGCGLVVLGLAGGFATYLEARQPRDTSGNMLAGLEFFIMALLALGVLGIGACLWLAGFSGRLIARQLTAAPMP